MFRLKKKKKKNSFFFTFKKVFYFCFFFFFFSTMIEDRPFRIREMTRFPPSLLYTFFFPPHTQCRKPWPSEITSWKKRKRGADQLATLEMLFQKQRADLTTSLYFFFFFFFFLFFFFFSFRGVSSAFFSPSPQRLKAGLIVSQRVMPRLRYFVSLCA